MSPPPPPPSSKGRYQLFRERMRKPPAAPGTESADSSGRLPDQARNLKLDPAKRKALRKEYIRWLWPHRRRLLAILILALLGAGLDVIGPLVNKYIIDNIVDVGHVHHISMHTRMVRLTIIGLGMCGVILLASLVSIRRSLTTAILNARLAFRLRRRLYGRMLRLPLGQITDLKTGGIISRLSSDVDHTMGLVQMALISPTVSVIRLVIITCIMFYLSWKIALMMIILLPGVMLLHNTWIRRVRPIYRSMGEDRARIDGRVGESFMGLRVVRGFGRETREELEYAVGHHTVIRKQMLAVRMQTGVQMIWDLVMPIASLGIIWGGSYLVIGNEIQIGMIFAFQGYIWRLIDPIMQIVNSISETQRGLASMERVFEILERPEDKPDLPDAIDIPPKVERLTFEDVDFSYRSERPVIQKFALDVKGGSVIALVGPSGAGKTTITDLVARFHDPTSGRILLNGIDLRQLRLRRYRSLLGIVQQDVFLFDGTIRDNIAYGRRGADDSRILEAARRANAAEFIEKLPEGYHTVIGERGVKLSGGQRQRLSIARAILSDPQILILDEATSNLDTESEQLIQASLSELFANRTTFVIAHRLSTVTNATMIVVLEHGLIREAGSHDELMAAKSLYAGMVERQRQRQIFPGMQEPEFQWAP